MWPINIISNRRQLEAVRLVNSVPGLVFLILVIVLLALKLQYHWYFYLALIGQLVSFIMIFFPFYANAVVRVSDDGITLIKRHSIMKSMKWSDIQAIGLSGRGGLGDYGNHIEIVIRLRSEEVKFGVYRYLFKSKRKLTRELFGTFLKFPDGKSKLPQELVDRHAAPE